MWQKKIKGVAKSFGRLVISILVIWFLAFATPRINSRGLADTDYLLMCGLPLGAYFAGKHWYHSVVFMYYGAIGMLIFIAAYFIYGELVRTFASDDGAALRDFLSWEVLVVAVVIACYFAGRFGNASTKSRKRKRIVSNGVAESKSTSGPA